ncbi:MAG: DUF3419 family protein [Bacteroidota bacterium]
MESLNQKILRREFEARIFVSFTTVLVVCSLSAWLFPAAGPNLVHLGSLAGFSRTQSLSAGFICAAVIMLAASLLRMWAGTILHSHRMMAFAVQTDALVIEGPYRFVRNPIYLADLIAMAGFALCLPLPGWLLPILFTVHYSRLVQYEELSLSPRFNQAYEAYRLSTPKLLPGWRSLRNLQAGLREFRINWDGFRNNALYALFIPGFLFASFTNEFFHAVLFGLPAVLDWARVHTKKGLSRSEAGASGSAPAVSASKKRVKAVFRDILYAQCWEDPSLDRAAFRIKKDDVVFTVTSGGCNALTFLLDNPRKVIALDINPFQNHLLRLKIAAFNRLTHDEILEFFGIRQSARRLELYEKIRADLDDESRSFWDRQKAKLRQGIIHAGRFEQYMKLLRFWVRMLVGQGTIEAFFSARTPQERTVLYQERWENVFWLLFTRVFLSRTVMTLLFDKAFFEQLGARFSFGKHFAGKTRHALTELPVRENYFLSYILLGRYYSEDTVPSYLRKEHYETIRSRLGRIEIVTDSCEHFFPILPANSVSKFNFTNIFEWMAPERCEALLRETVRVAENGSVLTYRNLLVPRSRPESLRCWIKPLEGLAESLFTRDLSFIYNRYVVESIQKDGVK